MKKRWTIKDQALFFKRISELLNEGYTISEALEFLKIHAKERHQKDIDFCLSLLNRGSPLYTIFQQLDFHSTCISFTFFAEKNGRIISSFQSISKILLNRVQEQSKMYQLLSYPILLFIFIIVMIFYFQQYMIPQFIQLYHSFHMTSSSIFKLFIWLHEHLLDMVLIIVAFNTILTILFIIFYKRKTPLQRQIFRCSLPFIGKIQKLWNSYYFSYHLSELIKSGASISDSLNFLSSDPKKLYLKETINKVRESLLRGESLATSCLSIPIWRKDLSFILAHGQMNGRLHIELYQYSQYCFEEFSEKMERWLKRLQPMLFVLIGLFIFLIYFVVMQPTFQMIHQL